MWKTGYESLPSFIPRVESTTEMKCMHVFSRSGAELDFVRSWRVRSVRAVKEMMTANKP